MGKLTHLQAFCSPDAKRGRLWTDGQYHYRRYGDGMERKSTISLDRWFGVTQQVAAMAGDVTWAYDDEPKTLTPQEALRALADGKCISASDHLCESSVIRLSEKFGMVCWTRDYHRDVGYRCDWFWDVTSVSALVGYHIVPDPSQPAEPPKPPLKVGDRVKRSIDIDDADYKAPFGTVEWCDGGPRVHIKWDGADYPTAHSFAEEGIEKIEAEPQVEYPLSTHEAHEAYKMGIKVACEIGGTGDPRNMLYEGYRWRIVGEGKCRCARHDCVTCGATQTEGK